MENFWDFSVWGVFNLVAVLLISLLSANIMKKTIPLLQASLIPTSVLGGGILIVVAGIYKLIMNFFVVFCILKPEGIKFIDFTVHKISPFRLIIPLLMRGYKQKADFN